MAKEYVIDNPNLMKEWHFEKNSKLKPENFSPGSNKKVWWKCDKGHEWQATISHRNNGRGCPYCSGKKVLKGYNDLQTVNPALAKEWNYEKNNSLKPEYFTANSDEKAWWECSKGHEWQARISSRNSGCGCPYCAGQKVLSGYNDLQTVNPKLAREWNYEKNIGLSPAHIMPGTTRKVWWKCSKGHEWQATIGSRNGGRGCPYCTGQKILRGYNDLQTANPTLAKEWNYEKNNEVTPMDVMPNSDKKAWWKCKKGHEWRAVIGSRNKGSGCPICDSEKHTSFPEYAIAYYLKKCGLEVIHAYKEQGYELDVYIPSKKIAVEYDGYFWHKDKIKKDLAKNLRCQKDGIQLYRIREGLSPLNDTSIDCVVQKNQKDLPQAIESILREITGINVDVDVKRDAIAIENLREYAEKERSILFSNPEIANEWNYEKNGKLKPENFSSGSNKKVWWKCSKGHEWQATINHRTKGRGCPQCAVEKRKKK